MNLDTYKSTLVDGVFVTLPSNDRSTLGMVEELTALGLHPVRRDYELAEDEEHAAFARFVLTEIVLKGYATHGGDGSPWRRDLEPQGVMPRRAEPPGPRPSVRRLS